MPPLFRKCPHCRRTVFLRKRERLWVLHHVFLPLTWGLYLLVLLPLLLFTNPVLECPRCYRTVPA